MTFRRMRRRNHSPDYRKRFEPDLKKSILRNPRYVVDLIRRVVTVSLETQKLVAKLPKLEF